MLELIGKSLGQYCIEAKIGEGGMAVVFRAYQANLKRYVALKILPPSLPAQDPKFFKRFQREAEAIARLSHPNILPAYEFGVDQGYSYIAMRYVEGGQTLSQVMRQPLSQERAIELISQIGQALDYVHQKGVIHRDLKPGNVLMDGDWVLLSDFGLAKINEASLKLTGSETSLGTPAYMSPEQARGEKYDHRIDIYALGIILYEMLTGSIPHKADTPLAILHKRSTEPPCPPRELNPNIPKRVEQVMLRALAMKPAERYKRAIDFVAALQQAAENKPASDDEKTVPSFRSLSSRSTSFKRMVRLTWLAAGVAIIAVTVWGGRWSNSNSDSLKPPPLQTEVGPQGEAKLSALTHTPTSSPTLTLTSTPVTPTDVSSPTPSSTPIPPTNVPTSTPTASPSPSATRMLIPPTAVPTVTPTSTPTVPAPTPVMATPSPTPTISTSRIPSGTLTLLKPISLDPPIHGQTDFEWEWRGDLPPNFGFEVCVWREDEPRAGAHDAVLDNRENHIEQLGENRYRLTVDITNAYGVRRRSGEYLWTVALVQISPAYADLGPQAEPARLRFELPGSSSDGSKESGGGEGPPSGIY